MLTFSIYATYCELKLKNSYKKTIPLKKYYFGRCRLLYASSGKAGNTFVEAGSLIIASIVSPNPVTIGSAIHVVAKIHESY